MILQELTELYKELELQGKIAGLGWNDIKVSYALCLDDNGNITQAICIKTEQKRGKKTVIAPQVIKRLPAQVKRAVGIVPNFLCDNSGYILGIDLKGKPERTKSCFEACKELHENILSDVDSPAAKAVLKYFNNWKPEDIQNNEVFSDVLDDILSGVNIIFRYNGKNVHEDEQICKAWQKYYQGKSDGQEMVCMVTGEYGEVERIHPSIKGVMGAQSSGAALVSFNAPAFCSYGKEQNYNAPVGKFATFAYTSALNYLLNPENKHVFRMGDTTVVCWAKTAETEYTDFWADSFYDMNSSYDEKDLSGLMKALAKGQPVTYQESMLDPNMQFYVLGLSPNSARLSVRFFLQNSFGAFIANAKAHQERLEIVRPSYDKFTTIPLWAMLRETINEKSKDKSPSPNMAGQTLKAILTNTPYPTTLLQGVQMRIRAEQKITRGRAAIIKAYYLKKSEHLNDIPKEVLTVALNKESKNIPYTLGRMFSILEDIQSKANPSINTTIKDRYFNSASATPARVFPTLINLGQKHLKKLSDGQRIYFEKQLLQLMDNLPEVYPSQLNLMEQGSFQLGYYHQTQERYTKREEK